MKNSAKIIDEVRAAIAHFKRFADAAGVPAKLRDKTAEALAIPRGQR